MKQEEVFEQVAMPVAQSVLEGYNGTIFACGGLIEESVW